MKKLFYILMCCCLISSCATKTKIEYVDREVVKYQTKVQHDTVTNNVHDSVFHTIFQKGDTIYDTKYVEKTVWRDKIVCKSDTCWRDSIQTVYKQTVVEKKVVPKWCYFSLGALALLLVVIIFRIKKWVL